MYLKWDTDTFLKLGNHMSLSLVVILLGCSPCIHSGRERAVNTSFHTWQIIFSQGNPYVNVLAFVYGRHHLCAELWLTYLISCLICTTVHYRGILWPWCCLLCVRHAPLTVRHASDEMSQSAVIYSVFKGTKGHWLLVGSFLHIHTLWPQILRLHDSNKWLCS